MSENTAALVYGVVSETFVSGPYLTNGEDNEPLFPKIQNGYYYFLDKQIENGDMHDDAGVLGRHSMNFIIAIYDADTDTLYYGELDT
ncbi:MAG: hypothetical protein HFE76_07150 [Firmicutes bacterium]|nr:hypothetical protein [Bacillota bacterium]